MYTWRIVSALLMVVIVCCTVNNVQGQALDRAHIDMASPLDKGSACTLATLNSTLSDLGTSNSKTLLLPATDRAKVACTWALTDNVTVPSNIQLYVPFGAKVAITAGKVLTLAKCPIIEGPGWLYGSSGKVNITAPGCTINMHTMATSGAGTSGSPWAGWDSSLSTYQVSDRVYYFPAGEYTFSTPLVISGQHVSFTGAGEVTTTLNWTGAAAGPALTWGIGTVAYETIQAEIAHFALRSSDSTTTGKVGIQLIDFSGSSMHDVHVANFIGGNSTALLVRGRDTSTITRLILEGNRPLRFAEDPVAGACYNLTPSQCGMDSSTISDLFLIGRTGGGYACITVEDRANLSSVRFLGYISANLCDNAFVWQDTSSTVNFQGPIISGIRHEQNTAATGWIVKITRTSGTGAIQGLTLDNIYGGNTGNGVYISNAVQGTVQIRDLWWVMGTSDGIPIFFVPSAQTQVLDIQGGLFSGHPSLNVTGIDPCTGTAGSATGTHACIKNMVCMNCLHASYSKYTDEAGNDHDYGQSAYFVNPAAVIGTPYVSIMGTIFATPTSGQQPAAVVSVGGSLTNGEEGGPFLTLLDCPAGIDPVCTGTFKVARVRVTVASADFSVNGYGEFYVMPVVSPNTPANNNEVVCIVCSDNVVANNPGIAGKFWFYHAEFVPPDGFFAFANNLGVTVNWMATVEVFK